MINLKIRIIAVIVLMIFNLSACKSVSVNTEPKKAELTVIMYHSFLKDTSHSGKYVITPSQFENDIIYLKNAGYSFVSVKDIENFRNAHGSLPQNSILITFDDGNYNNYLYIFPILKKYNIPALISPICYWVEKYSENGDKNPVYSILSKDDIKEMYDSGLVEFGNHTYNLHTTSGRFGTLKMSGETNENYQKMLYEDLKKADDIITEATGEKPAALVYPYGMISPESYDVAQALGYNILFSCTEGINRIYPNDNRYLLKRYNRPSGITSEVFFSRIFNSSSEMLK